MLLLIGTLLVFAVMFGLWLLSLRNHNFSYVDIGWSVNFAVLGVLYASLAPGYLPRRVLIATMFSVHGLRLGWHLASGSSASRKKAVTCSSAANGVRAEA
jgi:steroid 5-alpha reductase family enzyme